jgi:hypothetical protein
MHPIDPLTPETLVARRLWDAANMKDINSFLDVWESFVTTMTKRIGDAYEEGLDEHQQVAYEAGEQEGYEDGFAAGKVAGRKEAWAEAEEKIRIITGERLTPDS